MLLSGERRLRWERVITAMVAVGAMALSVVSPPTAAAVTYEVEPPFCDGAILRDYLAPLERMPRLHDVPPSGQLSFGSGNIVVRRNSALVVGGGSVGFWLDLHNYNHPARPRWVVTATLTQVDWRGRKLREVGRLQHRVLQIGREHSADFELSVGSVPAVYRVTAIFRSLSGRKLGGFSSYQRVVPATEHARLGLNTTIYRPGQTIFGRVENFGSKSAAYGVPYAIERLEGTAWGNAPESPRGPWIMPLLSSGPGLAGGCNGFRIPTTMPAGRYRMAKEIEFVNRLARFGSKITTLTAEFEIVP